MSSSSTISPDTACAGLEHRSDIQPLDGGPNGSGARCRDRCVAEMRMKLFELPHLAVGSPTKIAAPCLPQIRVGDCIEAARRVKARGQLMGQALVLDEAVLARRVDGLFVEALRVQFPALPDARARRQPMPPGLRKLQDSCLPDRYLIEMRY